MNIFTRITYGLYLVAVNDGTKDNGCIVNTLFQQTSQPETVSVTMNKSNLTTQMLLKSKKAAVSILSTETPFEIFKGFGMRSGKPSIWARTSCSSARSAKARFTTGNPSATRITTKT